MSRFSIILIENQISITADIVQAIGQHLSTYTLSIYRNIQEALKESPAAHIILLGPGLLLDERLPDLSRLTTTYPNIPLLLAISANVSEAAVLQLLQQGAQDYVEISKAGLVVLGRRLCTLQNELKVVKQTPAAWLSSKLGEFINQDTSQLAIQLIDANNCIIGWNSANAALFGISQANAIGKQMDDLPLPPPDLSRLKDMLDQARSNQEPFFVARYPLEAFQLENSWLHVQVYPVLPRQAAPAAYMPDVCIVTARVPKVSEISNDELHYNQELQILLEANRQMAGQLELKPTLEKVIEQTKSLLYGNNCQIYFLEKDNTTLRPVSTLGPVAEQAKDKFLTLNKGLLGKAAAAASVTVINVIDDNSEIPYPEDEYLICAPLTAARGSIGLIVISRRGSPFTQDDVNFFESLVQQASSAINNARLFEETQRSLNELAILYSASTAISTHWDDQGVLRTLIEQVAEAIHVDRGFIANWNKNENKGYVQAEYIPRAETLVNFRPLDNSINLQTRPVMQQMLEQQRPILYNINVPSLDTNEREMMRHYGIYARLLIPLMAKGETIGWIEMWETKRERVFTADEVRLSRALSIQIAVALQNTNYMEQTQQTLEEATALYRVASALTILQDPQAIISTVLEEYLRALDLKQGSVIMLNLAARVGIVKAHIHDDRPILPRRNERPQPISSAVLEGHEIPLPNNPVYEQLMRTRQAVVIDDPQADWLTAAPKYARDAVIPLVGGFGDANAFAVLVIPIRIRSEIVGVIVVENTRHNRVFSSWVISLGQAMADQLGVGLQNVELYESEFRRREQAETLREVSAIVSSSFNLHEVLERVLDQIGRVVKYDSAAIQLIEGKTRRVIAGRGFAEPEKHIGLTYTIAYDKNEPGSIVIHTRQPVVHGNIPEVFGTFKRDIHNYIRSWMGIPLIARDKVIGLISIDHAEIDAYSEEDVQVALAFGNQVAVALENARLYELEVRELERELGIAQEIQKTLLPQATPKVPDLDIAGRTTPARQVGGDFFHFFSVSEDQLGIAIGDVSGKGIPAALYMAAGITAIDTLVGPDALPGELLNKLNDKLYNRLHENKMNIALQIATFIPLTPPGSQARTADQKPGASLMTVASAGMIAPIGATEHGCRTLPVAGLPIGAMPSPLQVYTDDVFLIDPFTTIIFTSDGIVEAQNQQGEMFGFERLEETILEIISSDNAAAIADYIIDKAQSFIGDAEQHDDMTVVVVKYH